MSYALRLKIEGNLPVALNRLLRAHPMKRRRQNHLWFLLIESASRGKKPPAPLEKARIRIVRESWRMLDYDGLVGSLKPVVDALVHAKVIVDDRWSVTGQWEVDQVFRPKKDGTVLLIEVTGGD